MSARPEGVRVATAGDQAQLRGLVADRAEAQRALHARIEALNRDIFSEDAMRNPARQQELLQQLEQLNFEAQRQQQAPQAQQQQQQAQRPAALVGQQGGAADGGAQAAIRQATVGKDRAEAFDEVPFEKALQQVSQSAREIREEIRSARDSAREQYDAVAAAVGPALSRMQQPASSRNIANFLVEIDGLGRKYKQLKVDPPSSANDVQRRDLREFSNSLNTLRETLNRVYEQLDETSAIATSLQALGDQIDYYQRETSDLISEIAIARDQQKIEIRADELERARETFRGSFGKQERDETENPIQSGDIDYAQNVELHYALNFKDPVESIKAIDRQLSISNLSPETEDKLREELNAAARIVFEAAFRPTEQQKEDYKDVEKIYELALVDDYSNAKSEAEDLFNGKFSAKEFAKDGLETLGEQLTSGLEEYEEKIIASLKLRLGTITAYIQSYETLSEQLKLKGRTISRSQRKTVVKLMSKFLGFDQPNYREQAKKISLEYAESRGKIAPAIEKLESFKKNLDEASNFDEINRVSQDFDKWEAENAQTYNKLNFFATVFEYVVSQTANDGSRRPDRPKAARTMEQEIDVAKELVAKFLEGYDNSPLLQRVITDEGTAEIKSLKKTKIKATIENISGLLGTLKSGNVNGLQQTNLQQANQILYAWLKRHDQIDPTSVLNSYYEETPKYSAALPPLSLNTFYAPAKNENGQTSFVLDSNFYAEWLIRMRGAPDLDKIFTEDENIKEVKVKEALGKIDAQLDIENIKPQRLQGNSALASLREDNEDFFGDNVDDLGLAPRKGKYVTRNQKAFIGTQL
jgi:hypothetical protein